MFKNAKDFTFELSFDRHSPLFEQKAEQSRSAGQDFLAGMFCGPFGEPYVDTFKQQRNMGMAFAGETKSNDSAEGHFCNPFGVPSFNPFDFFDED